MLIELAIELVIMPIVSIIFGVLMMKGLCPIRDVPPDDPKERYFRIKKRIEADERWRQRVHGASG